MSVKNLIILAPELCGAFNAKKHAKVAELVWDHEVNHNGFPRVEGESAMERIAFLFDWPCINEAKKEYIRNLVGLNVLAHYRNEHGDNKGPEDAVYIASKLSADESIYPDVASILSVESAARGYWY